MIKNIKVKQYVKEELVPNKDIKTIGVCKNFDGSGKDIFMGFDGERYFLSCIKVAEDPTYYDFDEANMWDEIDKY